MVNIRPFRGLRYDTKQVNPDDVLAPPYDVVGVDAEIELLARSPYNAAHVELAPGKVHGRFDRAAVVFQRWQKDGQLVRDEEPAFYLYEQEFVVEGIRVRRHCFFAQVRLALPQEGIVRPHESTMAGPKAVRLDLMRATNANISPIFALFTDGAHRSRQVFKRVATLPSVFEAIDGRGDTHRLWLITEQTDIETLIDVLQESTVTIADGHHRYATALDYMSEHQGEDAAQYVLMGLTDIEDPGLSILPNHRLVRANAQKDLDRSLAVHFDVTDLTDELSGGREGAIELLEHVKRLAGGPSSFGIIEPSGRLLLAAGRSFKALTAVMPSVLSEASSHLDTLVLSELVLGPIFDIDADALISGAVDFSADAGEAYTATVDGPYNVAILVNSTPVQQVIDIADAGEVMPQKTTFFYPKLATGMVFSVLES